MSDAPNAQDTSASKAATVTTVPNTEVDKSIPEPLTGQPATPEQPAAAATSDPPAAAEKTNTPASTEKPKEKESGDKPEDLARSLLKGFQYKIAGVFPKKGEKTCDAKEDKKDEPSEAKEDEKENKESKDRRSASRKRNSLFGGFGLGKKDEKTTEEPNSPNPNKETQQEAVTVIDPAPEPARASESGAPPENSNERAGPVKRASLFGTLKQQFAKKDKSEVTNTATKEADATNNSAPVIPDVGTNDYIGQGGADNTPAEQVTEAVATVEAKAEKSTTKAEKRKSSMPFSFASIKKDKPQTDEDTTDKPVEKPLSPFAKFRATVKSKTSPRPIEKKEEVTTVPEVTTEEPSAKPILSEPESAVPNASPTVAASA